MRVIVIGAGYWGQNYIRELGHRCVQVIDPDPQARARVEKRFGIRTSPKLGKLALEAAESFDAAIITTPPETHHHLALPILEADKYVLVEKPLAVTYEHALELARFPKCMAGLVYLYHPEVEYLKTTFSNRQLSHAFSRRTNDGPVRPYLNAMWDLAPHDISIFNFVTQSEPFETEAIWERDWCILSLTDVHLTAIAYVSWHGSPKVRRVELVPELGHRIIFDDMAVVLEKPPLTRMIEAFLSGSWDRCTGADGAAVVKVLEECSNT